MPLGGDFHPLDAALGVEEDVQGAGGHLPGVQQLDGARRGVAGIGEGLQPLLLPPLVQPGESLPGQVALPPGLEEGGGPGGVEAQGDGGDGAHILRHVVPLLSVAPGHGLDQDAVHVAHGNGDAVDFGFHHIDGAFPLQSLQDAFMEAFQIRRVVGVFQGEHGEGVFHRLEALQGPPVHPAGGGIGGDDLRVGGLQLQQGMVEPVVFLVGNLRGGLHIVEVVVVADLRPEGLRLRPGGFFRRRRRGVPLVLPGKEKEFVLMELFHFIFLCRNGGRWYPGHRGPRTVP